VHRSGRSEGFDGVALAQKWPSRGYPTAGQTGRRTTLKTMYDEFGLQLFSIQT
jgi:hypothetical protein